ncbi:aminopeptidase P family protein [Nitratireductor sp. GISD-1A_MAKvit]|uniref:aminopeptidase P family protein n=1 Tax=Nitratireductor sp. GISD-1A_MAKvit TaxID=3234198 RepID=UPI003465065B
MLDTTRRGTAEIISALREEMSERGLDAFLLPRFDAHQGEYVAPHDQRLAYVTGFSGSAGMAIVTAKTVALFVDGRYQVQVRNECAGPLFSHHHIFNEPPECWLAENAQPAWRVGYDAMHLPPSWFDRFARACDTVEAVLLAQDTNPVDAIWPDQPPLPMGRISAFPLQYSGRTSKEKSLELAADLKRESADFIVDTQPDNIAWLLNVRGSDVAFNPMPHSFILAGRDGRVVWFVADKKLDVSLRESIPDHVGLQPFEAFLPELETRIAAGQRVMIDPEFSPVAVRQTLEKIGAEILPRKGLITLAKAVKNVTELQGIRNCHLDDGVAWTEFHAWLSATVPSRAKAGNPVSEREAEEKILELRQARPGFISESFNSISAAAGNAAMCHYATSPERNAPILPENPYLLDSGGQYETGTTDATRSYAFGPRPEGYDRAYTAVYKAFHALMTLRFPKGTQGHHIDAICRRPLWDLGLDYDHGTGHGVGHQLSVHEQPQRIGKPYNPVDLKPGMVLSIEPGYYEAGAFGIRIENLVEIVEENDGFLAFRNLTFAPIETRMLLVDKLTAQERQWINAYHEELRKTFSPHLSPATRRWLDAATADI